MNNKLTNFDVHVNIGIITNNGFGIKEVYDLESIKSMHFEREKYLEIEPLIKAGDIDALGVLPFNDSNESEFLEIMNKNDFVDIIKLVVVQSSIKGMKQINEEPKKK